MVDETCQYDGWQEYEFDAERVMGLVIGGFELSVHQIDGAERWDQVEYFHGGVVDGYEVGEQVQVARGENECEEQLAFAR